jgi:glycosyltransferase involved in cell wall biosynthesis
MLTPRIDPEDDLRGFIYDWVIGLSEKIDKLVVITAKIGSVELPRNVEVHPLTEKDESPSLFKFFYRFNLKIIKILRKEKIDVIFSHMYPEFTIFSALYAKLFRIPIVTWYTHKAVTLNLRLALFSSDRIVTASKESFRIKSNKVRIIGHGINVDRFKANPSKNEIPIILSLSRISPIKDHETFIRAISTLTHEKNINIKACIVGRPHEETDERYYEKLKQLVKQQGLQDDIVFEGFIPHRDIHKYYQSCDVFVNTSHTGSIDKSVLEAMACEKPIVTCNEAFVDVLRDYSERCMFEKKDYQQLSEKIEYFLKNAKEAGKIGKNLREIVVKNHSTITLIDNLYNVFKEVS